MGETTVESVPDRWCGCRDSLAWSSRLFHRRPDGALQFNGERPGPDWHAHGYFRRSLLVMVAGVLRRVPVWKRRWRHVDTHRTCHSRPPDDPPRLRSSTLVVSMVLWAWLSGGVGLQNCLNLLPVHDLPSAAEWPCERTALRWLARARAAAESIQQAIRLAILERSEPRPVERLFPGGLSPPATTLRRRWQDPPLVGCLWRALAQAWRGSVAFSVPVAILLAEARGRWVGPTGSPIP